MKSKRNAVIELLRFLAASSVLVFHVARSDLRFATKTIFTLGPWRANFFRMGNLGVEFFFVVSGYLMAYSVYKKVSADGNAAGSDSGRTSVSVGEETVVYVFRKVKALYPYYLSACILISAIWLLEGTKISSILKRLPSLLFLQRTGISEETFLGVTWYVSSMLIAMALIYPFLRKYYFTFTTLIAPLGGILMTGMLMKMTGNLLDAGEWFGFTYKCNLRALAEIAMGTTCFEISRRLENVTLSRSTRILLTASTVGIILLTPVYMCSDGLSFNGVFLLAVCYIVTVIFSRKGIWGDSDRLYGSRLFIYLGSLSVSVFFYQNLFRNLVPLFFKGASKGMTLLLIYVSTVLFSAFMNEVIGRYKAKHK